MKRFSSGEGKLKVESLSMANVLMLLSKGGAGAGRVFECKTCSRKFGSFQALGGHRASHKKPRVARDCDGEGAAGARKPRVHGCPICGVEFAVGQALGGHMRRHRGGGGGGGEGEEGKKDGGERRMLCLDLNLAPPESDVECRDVGIGGGGLGGVRQIPLVDFF